MSTQVIGPIKRAWVLVAMVQSIRNERVKPLALHMGCLHSTDQCHYLHKNWHKGKNKVVEVSGELLDMLSWCHACSQHMQPIVFTSAANVTTPVTLPPRQRLLLP